MHLAFRPAAALPLGNIGQVLSIPLTGPSGGIIQKFLDAANQMFFNGENASDALLSETGEKVRIATLNLNYVLGEQSQTLYDNLDRQIQPLFQNINNMIDAVNALPDHIATVVELANLDLIEFTIASIS